MSLLDLYFLTNWLPTVLNDLGASVSAAAVIGSMLQIGGVVGTFALGSVIDRFSFRALALVYFVAVFAVGAIGQLGHSIVFVTMAIFAAGSAWSAARSPPTHGRGILSDLGQVHRRRLGARHRPGRLDHRSPGRRRADDREMEHRIGVHGRRHRSLLRGAGGVLAEPAGRHGRQQGHQCAVIV
jgi:Cyanate permease